MLDSGTREALIEEQPHRAWGRVFALDVGAVRIAGELLQVLGGR
jgi:hypothetical protein